MVAISCLGVFLGLFSCHIHGLLKKWAKGDVERFVKFLGLHNYLSEDLVFGSQGSVYGVLKPGSKSLDAKVCFVQMCNYLKQMFYTFHSVRS